MENRKPGLTASEDEQPQFICVRGVDRVRLAEVEAFLAECEADRREREDRKREVRL